MHVPALNLKRQYQTIKREILHNIAVLCSEQQFVLGKTVADFEKSITSYCGTRYAVGCASGTDAILLSLLVGGIGPGDEVIVPSFTFIASVEPIVRVGARPVFGEIAAETYNLDPTLIEKKITKKTKAIIVVHLYGQTADMKPILKLARKYKLLVIEDACQAIGSVYGPLKKRGGNLGDVGCFSFFPTKNLGGYGDGGMIVTNRGNFYNVLLMLRDHGSNRKYYHPMLGMNSRLDALQAIVLQTKLKYLRTWIRQRITKAKYYNKILQQTFGKEVSIPYVEHNNCHTYHQYVIRIKGVMDNKRDALIRYLHKKGVGATVYYPRPCHLQKCFSYIKYKKGSLPISEDAARTVMALPIYPELLKKNQDYVVQSITEFLS